MKLADLIPEKEIQEAVLSEKRFSWDVEQDSMNWEHAVEGIRYFEEKIEKIKEITE